MKRCPECRRDYYDETLLYCLEDGTALLQGSVSLPDEPHTMILHDSNAGPATGSGIHTTDLTQNLPTRILKEQITRHPRMPVIAAATIVVLAIMGAGAWYLIPRKIPRPGLNMQPSKLVTGLKGIPGNVGISPDAKYVVYSLFEDGKTGLWLKQVSEDAAIPIVPPANNEYRSTTFSPEGDRIYFVMSNRTTDQLGSLYSVPILGGKEPRRVKEHVNSRISLSPNGSEFAFIRQFPETRESTVMIAKTDGSGEDRQIASRTGTNWFDGLAWSPDGKSIACAAGTSVGGFSSSIAMVPITGGEPVTLGTHKFGGEISSTTWLPDGSGLLITAPATLTAKSAVWHMSYPGGLAERITKDLNSYSGVDISGDGNTAVMSYGDWYSRIWVVGPDGAPKKITNGRDDGLSGVAYLNDGRIVYTAVNNEEQNIWVVNPDGSDAKAITTGTVGALIAPYVAAPDGRSIVFSAIGSDNISHIWRVNVDGSGLKQLSFSDDYFPMFSRDGKNILFSRQEGRPALWKMPADGGEAVPLSAELLTGNTAGMSADGKNVACVVTDMTSNPPKRQSALVDLETGKLVEYIELPANAGVANLSPDGKQYVYMEIRDGVVNLWTRPVSGGPARPATKFNEAFIDRFAQAPDGKSFAVTHTEGTNEIVLVKNFR